MIPGEWLQDLESLEAICQDECTRKLFLRMSAMSQAGRMGNFLLQLAHDDDVDEELKGTLAELAREPSFLLAVEDYFRRTQRFH